MPNQKLISLKLKGKAVDLIDWLLIEQRKQVIVVYAAGHLGREIWDIQKGLFKVQLKHLIDI